MTRQELLQAAHDALDALEDSVCAHDHEHGASYCADCCAELLVRFAELGRDEESSVAQSYAGLSEAHCNLFKAWQEKTAKVAELERELEAETRARRLLGSMRTDAAAKVAELERERDQWKLGCEVQERAHVLSVDRVVRVESERDSLREQLRVARESLDLAEQMRVRQLEELIGVRAQLEQAVEVLRQINGDWGARHPKAQSFERARDFLARVDRS